MKKEEIFLFQGGKDKTAAQRGIDHLGGSDSFKTRFIETASGLAELRTKNGMPQVIMRETKAEDKASNGRGFVVAVASTMASALLQLATALVRVAGYAPKRHRYIVSTHRTNRNSSAIRDAFWNDVVSLYNGNVYVNGTSLMAAPLPVRSLPFLRKQGESYPQTMDDSQTLRVIGVRPEAVNVYSNTGSVEQVLLYPLVSPLVREVSGPSIDVESGTVCLAQMWYQGAIWDDVDSEWMQSYTKILLSETAPYANQVESTSFSLAAPNVVPQSLGWSPFSQTGAYSPPGCTIGAYGQCQLDSLWNTGGEDGFTIKTQYTALIPAVVSGTRAITGSATSFGNTASYTQGMRYIGNQLVTLTAATETSVRLESRQEDCSITMGWYQNTTTQNVNFTFSRAFAPPGEFGQSVAGIVSNQVEGSLGGITDFNGSLNTYTSTVAVTNNVGLPANLFVSVLHEQKDGSQEKVVSRNFGSAILGEFDTNYDADNGRVYNYSPMEAWDAHKAAWLAAYLGTTVYNLMGFDGPNQPIGSACYDIIPQPDIHETRRNIDAQTRDFFYVDLSENIYGYIRGGLSGQDGVARLFVECVWSVRGVEYSTLLCDIPSLSCILALEELQTGPVVMYLPAMKTRFMFAPIACEQGDFHPVAYTTSDEVIDGALPRFFLDMQLTVGDYGGFGSGEIEETSSDIKVIPFYLLEVLYGYIFSTTYGLSDEHRYVVNSTANYNAVKAALFDQSWRIQIDNGVIRNWPDDVVETTEAVGVSRT